LVNTQQVICGPAAIGQHVICGPLPLVNTQQVLLLGVGCFLLQVLLFCWWRWVQTGQHREDQVPEGRVLSDEESRRVSMGMLQKIKED
jgi:nitrogen fixation-related uncharacterized protein